MFFHFLPRVSHDLIEPISVANRYATVGNAEASVIDLQKAVDVEPGNELAKKHLSEALALWEDEKEQ